MTAIGAKSSRSRCQAFRAFLLDVLTLGHLVRKVPAEIDLCRDELTISDGMYLQLPLIYRHNFPLHFRA